MEFHLRYSVTYRIVDDYCLCDRVYGANRSRSSITFGSKLQIEIPKRKTISLPYPSLPPIVIYGTLTGTGGCTHRSSRQELTRPLTESGPGADAGAAAAGGEHTEPSRDRDARYARDAPHLVLGFSPHGGTPGGRPRPRQLHLQLPAPPRHALWGWTHPGSCPSPLVPKTHAHMWRYR